ncbi:MAG: BACON domain-containing protein [Bacteroidales bacterium]|nr:BACON domain-containing protein [Bacteroidales bacterium]
MKTLKFWLMAAILVPALGVTFVSCGGDDDDEPTVTLSTNVSSLTLPATSGASQSFNVATTGQWTVSGAPTWLTVSPTAGTGAGTVTVTTKSANETAEERECTLVISNSTTSVSVSVTQEAGLENCTVTPTNITTLYFGMACNFSATSNVRNYQVAILASSDYNRLTSKELLEELQTRDKSTIDDETIYSTWFNIAYWDEAYDFYIASLAYDADGNRGEVQVTKVTKPAYVDGDADAWLTVTGTYSSTKMNFTFTKQGRCAKYDLIYGANILSAYATSSNRMMLMAFEMQYYRNNGTQNWLAKGLGMSIDINYPNDHTFSCSYSPTATSQGYLAAGRGLFEDGSQSSDICFMGGEIGSSSNLKGGRIEKFNLMMEAKAEGFFRLASPADFR